MWSTQGGIHSTKLFQFLQKHAAYIACSGINLPHNATPLYKTLDDVVFFTFPNTEKRPADNIIQSRDNKKIIESQQIYVTCEQTDIQSLSKM